MDPMMRGVFVVDDDLDCRTSLGEVLEDLGMRPVLFHDPREALAALARTAPALIVTEMGEPGTPAAAPFHALLAGATRARLPVIVFSGWPRTAADARLPFQFVPKPEVRILLEKARALVSGRRRDLENPPRRARREPIVDAA